MVGGLSQKWPRGGVHNLKIIHGHLALNNTNIDLWAQLSQGYCYLQVAYTMFNLKCLPPGAKTNHVHWLTLVGNWNCVRCVLLFYEELACPEALQVLHDWSQCAHIWLTLNKYNMIQGATPEANAFDLWVSSTK